MAATTARWFAMASSRDISRCRRPWRSAAWCGDELERRSNGCARVGTSRKEPFADFVKRACGEEKLDGGPRGGSAANAKELGRPLAHGEDEQQVVGEVHQAVVVVAVGFEQRRRASTAEPFEPIVVGNVAIAVI